MAFASPDFVLLILASVLLTQALPRYRAWVLALVSSWFLASHLRNALEITPLCGVLALGYGSIELLRRRPGRVWLWLSLTLLLGSFVALKRYSFVSSALLLPFPYLTVGLSYVLFRLIHLMVDAKQGELTRRAPLLTFFNYCLSFLSFTAGPIQLYSDFESAQGAPLVLSRARAAEAMSRIVRGFVKIVVISATASYVFALLSAGLLAGAAGPRACLLFCLSASVYTTYLYANFAGYMDVVIGVGNLMGQELPENFDHPFAARNFLEFWSRWHMTLSSWFRLYLFNPLVKVLARRFTSAQAAPLLAVLAFFVTFLVMGVWHGSSSVFVVYGLMLGAGASVNKLWQSLMSAWLGKRAYKQLCQRPLVEYLSRGLTFAYFAAALTCLWLSLNDLGRLLHGLGAVGALGSFALLSLGGALAFATADALSAGIAKWRARFQARPRSPWLHDVALASQILLIFTVSSFFHKAPEFVYRAF
jgi:D-alanyl-lipoteichoic acid acyltransferase DltB (MBOAT superfamily)